MYLSWYSMRVIARVCVCVDHLQRCKTSHVVSFSNKLQGAVAHSWVYCQRSYSWIGRISRLITVTYLLFVPLCISLQPFDVIQCVIQFSLSISPCWAFQIFIFCVNQFFVTATFRYCNFPFSQPVFKFYIISIFRAGGGQAVGFLNIVFKARTKSSRCKCVHWCRSPTWWYQPFEGNTLPGCIADSTWLRNLQILNGNSFK